MNSSSFEPYTIITTVQPLLMLWVLAISFFTTLAVVAVLSKGRSWYELACFFLLIFVATTVLGLTGAHFVMGVKWFDVQVITLR
ncbi:hypothetical protein FIV42_28785 [Persicimonas caeni]|uniref:Uncharacterized protein n=1 Tax=Persicimonas caeni TaxID=2292766 RepID=A0A4Y6Q1W9_PERCE|nr:hypothetical protein [Persicimonas caeni]QDG54598.1 hypothetical protein FIV42_28785 [Persicimonas caeni]QED35819.1 hypothetical protein FRD00_28780 [Persicimonas caeni]